MKKFFPLFVSLMLPLGAWAQQNGPKMDAANQAIIDTCRDHGGLAISSVDGDCTYVGCAYVGTGSTAGIKIKGDNERVAGTCDIGPMRTKAQLNHKAQIDKRLADAEKASNKAKEEADRALKKAKDDADKENQDLITKFGGGKGSMDVGDLNKNGIPNDDEDIAIAKRMLEEAKKKAAAAGKGSGDGDDDEDGNGNGGKKGSGSKSGSGNVSIADGGQSGQGQRPGGAFLEWCDFTVFPGHPCYKVCTRRSFPLIGKKGEDRKACQECLARYEGVIVLDKKGKAKGVAKVKIDCSLSGRKKGPNGECLDINGNVSVGRPSGSVGGGLSLGGNGGNTGAVVAPGGNGSAGGNIIIGGGASASANLPAFCYSDKSKDKKECAKYLAKSGSRFGCSSGSSVEDCIGSAQLAAILARSSSGEDCIDCSGRGSRRGSTLSGIAEIAGAVLGPAAQFGSAYVGARAYQKSNEAWAGAQKYGYEQCRLSQESFQNYLSSNELPGMTPEQRAQQNCNGYSLGAFAGMGGMGGMYGGYYGAGYTPGMIGGMMGPYGMYNPYGTGGMYSAGYPAGGGMYSAGINGGFANGISIAGGINSGMYNGGGMCGMGGCAYPAGGMYAAGGGMYSAGYPAGGFNGGFNGGMYSAGYPAGGMMVAGGIYAAGGFNGGGFNGGMYSAGVNGGMYSAGFNGGFNGGGMYSAGVNGGGWAGGAGWGTGGYYGQQNNYYASQQAANIDGMLQQQGMAYQMGQMGGMSGYGYGSSAGMYPSNMGFGLNMGFNAGISGLNGIFN